MLVLAGAREVARPLLTSAATTVMGFLPIFALTDQAGRLFEPLALTKSLAISGAVIVGTLLVPALCRLLLPPWQLRKPLLVAIAGVTGGGSSVAYAASKGALNTMTLSLARALAPKIRVNAICPAFIDTRWFSDAYDKETAQRLRERVAANAPLQVVSNAQDIADAALFLISDASRRITGETMLVDAGAHLGYAPLRAR